MLLLEDILGYRFKNRNLLSEALCHKSMGREEHYERLEFLGDRVLALGAVTLLCRLYPYFSEGDLAVSLSHLVSEETLYRIARSWKLETFIKCQGKHLCYNQAILADVVEAIIGAIYLDSHGIEDSFMLIEKVLSPYMINLPLKNPKTILQEWLMKKQKSLPEYRVVRVLGPDHDPTFFVECVVNGSTACGRGKNKREAQMQAAKALLNYIGLQ